MLARPTCTATNSPHEPPVKASPVRSSTCAHRLMVERASQSLVRLIMLTYQAGTGEPFPNIKPGRWSMLGLSSRAHRRRLGGHAPSAPHQIQFEFDQLRRTESVRLGADAADAGAQAALQGAERLPLQSVKRISGRVRLRDGRAGKALIPIVVMAVRAGEIELALSLQKQLASFGDKRLKLWIALRHDRHAARLLSQECGERQQLTAFVRQWRCLLTGRSAIIDALFQVCGMAECLVERRISGGDALHAGACVAVTIGACFPGRAGLALP